MARRRNPPEMVRAKWQLAERLRAVRTDLFGERGLADFARSMGVPVRTWYSYETGVTVPSEVLLRFIELTSVDTGWLLHGRGEQFLGSLPAQRVESRRLPLWAVDSPHAEAEDSGSWEESGSGERPAFRGGPTACLAELPSELGGQSSQGLEPDEELISTAQATLPNTLEGVLVARGYHCLRIVGEAMQPVAADGAIAAYSAVPEPLHALEGKLVVASVDTHSRPIMRWFFPSGQFAMLRAENPAFAPATHLINLRDESVDRQIRRVLWVGSPH